MAVKTKNFWILLLCMLAGLTLGNFIGELVSEVSALSFLSYRQTFGMDTPLNLDFDVFFVVFQMRISLTLAGVIGLIMGVVMFRKI